MGVNRQWNVAPEDFVEIWQSSESAAEAARLMGLPANVCRRRATYYRKQGIPLKKFSKGRVGRKRLDITRLKKVADESRRDYPN